jgi:CRP/FNR family transcriptional regulator, cyclic AMP receptor protein
MNKLEEQLHSAGLQVVDHCERLATYSPDLLEHSPLLEDFTAEEADVLAASMLLVRAAPGQVLIKEGDAGDWMMLILKGTVDVTKRIELRADDGAESLPGPVAAGAGKLESTESRVAVLQRGAAIGEMSMLDSGLRYTTCTAIEPVEAGVLGSHAIGLLIRDHPGVGAKLLVKITQLMAQRLRNVSNQLVKLLQKA